MRLELTIYSDGGVQGGGWLSDAFDDGSTVEDDAVWLRRSAAAYVEDRDEPNDVARVLVTVEDGDALLHEVVPTLALRQMMALLRFVGEP